MTTTTIHQPALTPVPLGKACLVDHEKWRIESLQMANWGGFHGRHQVLFAEGSTLMSGASGTGKSTLLDAWIALMMPSDTPFNGASNDAGGRARSAEQRNLLTYLRGKMDSARVDGSDQLRDHVLRGRNGEHVWGGVAGTFVNDAGRRFTVARLYFLRAGAAVNSDVATSYATFEGYLDLAGLEALAASRFDKRSLKSVGITPYDTYREFEDTIHTRLGIGGGDGGRKAMRLLARVQAGMEVKRVDTLYKAMVLEKPGTYAAADEALAHFADLEASYAKMVDEASKMKALARLPELQDDLAQAEATAALVAAFGSDRTGPTPFALWRLRTERALLDTAVEANRAEYTGATATHAQAKAEFERHTERLDQIAEEKRAAGGDAIDTRNHEIYRLTALQDEVYDENVKFQFRTEAIGLVVPETASQFAQAQADAADFLAGHAEREAALRSQVDAVNEELAPLTTAKRDLMEEKASLAERKGRGMMASGLHNARVQMAHAAGLDPFEDLPFVAELIDVLPDEQQWRKAIETTLGGIARTVLVDRRRFEHLSAAIDPVKIRPRIRFQAVDLAEHEDYRGDPDYVSGKLAFKDSPFSHWVQDRVTADAVDHLCVPDSKSLNGPQARVTPAGQTRRRDRGAHGESGDGYVIGFTNEQRLADTEHQLDELEPRIEAVRDRIREVQARIADLGRQKEAHTFVADTRWADIDHLSIGRRIEELTQEVARLRASSSVLDQLQVEQERLAALRDKATKAAVLAGERLEKLTKEHAGLVDEQDDVSDQIEQIEADQTAMVSPKQQDYLDKLFASSWDSSDLRGFNSNVRGLRQRLRDEGAAALTSARRATSAMESMFEQYQQRWSVNNLGVSVASAEGYREILDRITSEGLHERRNKWRREFSSWSSDDLLQLNDAFDKALADIEDRLEPINRILATLPFGGKGVLQIKHRRLKNDEVSHFRRELRTLSSDLPVEMTEDQVERRFKKLREFMALIAIPEGHTKSSTSLRDRYLDVRQHVVVNAVCQDASGTEVATYDSLGGKSGGETQELVAFIVGSALRYQLGDETRSRPRFAPVFLDEGFVKSDSEFAGRSVRAWQDLGFQLIIGAPLDKVTALEPHMDLLLTVTKNPKGLAFVHRLADDPDAEEDGR